VRRRGADRGGHHRSGRAGEAVLDQGLGSIRERIAVTYRGGGARVAARPMGPTTATVVPDTVEELLDEQDVEFAVPWIAIVWNDPVNLMDYVVYVVQKLFGYSRDKATHLMYQVHNEGKAVVAAGSREKCETDVARLHSHGLWATMEHDR